MTIPLSCCLHTKALASHTLCSAHALLRFTSIFSVHARITNTITIPGGASIKPAAVAVHVEASEIQEAVNVTVTAASCELWLYLYTCQLVTH